MKKEKPSQNNIGRFFATNRLNTRASAIGPFDQLNETIRTYLLGNGVNEARFLQGLPTVMFFQLGFGAPMILSITRKDYIDHAKKDPAYTTDSRWFGPSSTKLCNTVLMAVEELTNHSYLLSENISSSEGKTQFCFYEKLGVSFSESRSKS